MQKALAIAVIALVAMLPACSDAEKAQYRNAQFGWTISHAPSMKRTVVDVQDFHVSLNGVVISNFDGVTARKWLEFRRFPTDGVAFGFLHSAGGPFPDTTPPEARFPLSPGRFTLSRSTQKPAPRPLTLGVVANGTPFLAEVWFGPRASLASREAIWKVVRSLRFPPQRTGTMSGSYYVLEDSSRYPANLVVRVEGKPETSSYVPPFYLVHAPGGFYAVSWQPKFEPKCHMGFDRPKFEFYCRTSRGRWDRMGRVLEGPESDAQHNDSLDLGQAKIGRGGQVLVGDWRILADRDSQYARYERRYWPSVR